VMIGTLTALQWYVSFFLHPSSTANWHSLEQKTNLQLGSSTITSKSPSDCPPLVQLNLKRSRDDQFNWDHCLFF
jgi:hypothetical protein